MIRLIVKFVITLKYELYFNDHFGLNNMLFTYTNMLRHIVKGIINYFAVPRLLTCQIQTTIAEDLNCLAYE